MGMFEFLTRYIMPFIDSKVSVKTTPEQRKELKERFSLFSKHRSLLFEDVAIP